MSDDVFLSYSSNDRNNVDRVSPIRDALSALGFNVFWDLQTPAGVDWDTWIRDKLDKAKCAIVVWSESSIQSPNVRHEATIAARQGKLISALIDPLDARQFPMGLYTEQAANLVGWSGDDKDQRWVRLAAEVQAKHAPFAPLWLQKTIHALEADLMAERARVKSAESRALAIERKIAESAQAVLEAERDRDRARAEAAEIEARQAESAKGHIEFGDRIAGLQQRLKEAEAARDAKAREVEEAGRALSARMQQIAGLEGHIRGLEDKQRAAGIVPPSVEPVAGPAQSHARSAAQSGQHQSAGLAAGEAVSPWRRPALGFAAGVIAFMTAHQGVMLLFRLLGIGWYYGPWSLESVSPFGLPFVLHQALLFGLWGTLFTGIRDKVPGNSLWLRGVVFALAGPMLAGQWFLEPLLLGGGPILRGGESALIADVAAAVAFGAAMGWMLGWLDRRASSGQPAAQQTAAQRAATPGNRWAIALAWLFVPLAPLLSWSPVLLLGPYSGLPWLGFLAALGLAVLAWRMRGAALTGLERGLYWAGCAGASLYAVSILNDGSPDVTPMAVVWFGILVAVSAVFTAWRRGPNATAGEATIYWLGSALALIAGGFAFGDNFLSVPDRALVGGFAGGAIAVLTGWLLWRLRRARASSAPRAENV